MEGASAEKQQGKVRDDSLYQRTIRIYPPGSFPFHAGGISLPAIAAPRDYRIDPEHASFGFLVSHIGYQNVLGMFREVAGGFRFDEENRTISDVIVTVKTASVFTNHEKRDEHLRKEEFFWTDKYPEMTFTMTSAQKTGERTGKITGNLTLRGVTKPITLGHHAEQGRRILPSAADCSPSPTTLPVFPHGASSAVASGALCTAPTTAGLAMRCS